MSQGVENENCLPKTAWPPTSEPQRRLIFLRYFRDFSQTEVAKILGLTQVKVSREEKKIVEILREQLV